MDYNFDVFKFQFPIVKRFVYHLIYYRKLFKAYNDLELKSEFWTITIDAHLLQAIMNWCKVFGADGCNQIHWKNLSTKDKTDLYKSFRENLFSKTNFDKNSWEDYWKEINNFRNKFAAHKDINFNEPVPDLSKALEIAFIYDEWVRDLILPDIFEEPPLKKFAAELGQRISPHINHLIKETKIYNDANNIII